MKKLTISITATLILCLISAGQIAAQDLNAGEVLPELTYEQRAERGEVNTLALVTAFILHALEQGVGIAEAGRFTGETFAESWPDDLTPEYFVIGMNSNWQMYGITVEVLVAENGHVKARRDRLSVEIEDVYDIKRDDIEMFYEHVQKGIANSHGLSYAEEVIGDHIEFVVSARR